MRKILRWMGIALLVSSCSSIDCQLNNQVMTSYRLQGDVTKLVDTLSISTNIDNGNDSVVLNRAVGVDSITLPISYAHSADVFYFKVTTSNHQFIDTVKVSKQDYPRFESVDCPAAIFHKITDVSTTNHAIDSIVIHNANVNYESYKANFYIYFKKYLY